MNEELDKKLVENFPLLYRDRYASMQSTCMCWGFACSDGWFDIIWDLSSKLEPIIQGVIDDNPNLSCTGCGCSKDRHYAYKTQSPGGCLAIHIDLESKEEPPGNYYACFCNEYKGAYPKASQVKEKYGGLRFYMTCGNDEVYNLIKRAEELSYETCEQCGDPGREREGNYWINTLCDNCNENWEEICKKRWETEE
jgi:hypothetical protein